MFSKSLIALVLFVAFTTAAPIASAGPSSYSEYQYLSRRNPTDPPTHASGHGHTQTHHEGTHTPSVHTPTHPAHHEASHHAEGHGSPIPAQHGASHHATGHGSPSGGHGTTPPHSPHAHQGSHTPHNTPPHSPTHGSAHGSAHGSEHGSEHGHSPPGSPTHEAKKHMINEVKKSGSKISEHDVLHIWPIGRKIPGVESHHAWLEKGNEGAGMQHIMHEHGTQFAGKGIHEHDIPKLAEKATRHGEIVGTQGSSRTIYKTEHDGATHHVAVETSNNGFVVSMNPSSEKSVRKAAKAWQKRAQASSSGAGGSGSASGVNPTTRR